MAEALFDSPIGPLFAVATSAGLQRLEFVRHASYSPSASHRERRSSLEAGTQDISRGDFELPNDSRVAMPEAWQTEPLLSHDSADPEGQRILEETQSQLSEYFDGSRCEFDLPLDPSGSDFQMRVWRAIAAIPYGQVLSYGELALAAGSPGAFRAAGSACGVNRITIIIPCHRVVGANRAIGGYGGGLEIKTALLKLEGSLEGLRGGQGALAFV